MFYKRIGTFLSNIAALLVAFFVTYVLRFGWEPDERAFQNVNDAMVFAFLLFSYFVVFMFYRPKMTPGKRGLFSILKNSFLTSVLMAAVFSTVIYTTHVNDAVPRMFFAYFFATNFVLMAVFATAIELIRRGVKKRNMRKTVVLTDKKDRAEVIRKLLREGRDDTDVVGVISMNESRKDTYYQVKTFNQIHKRLRGRAALVEVDPAMLKFEFEKVDVDSLTFLKRHQIDQVVIAVDKWNRDKIREIVDEVAEMGIDTIITLDSLAMDQFESKLEDYGTTQVLRIAPRIFTEGELVAKRLMDICGSLVGCLICVVAGIFVAPLIWLTDRGPVIYRQKRVGKNGKYFYIYKFRSMYTDADARRAELMKTQNEMDDTKMFKMKDDPRITPIGKFIRKTSIDELPQFFNVLKGDMSLVGTRPPMIDEYNQYSRHHKRRLTLKPGITGLWQVSGRSQITDFEEIVRLDCYYIDHWSLLYDIKILFMTVGAVLTGKGSE